MQIRLAFGRTRLGRFLVIAEDLPLYPTADEGEVSIDTFDHEDAFLELLVRAGIRQDRLESVLIAVFTAIISPFPQEWIELDLSPHQRKVLLLKISSLNRGPAVSVGGDHSTKNMRGVATSLPLHNFLLQAPTPFAIVSGAEHRFTFINEPYVRLLGRLNARTLPGKTVRAALPELEGQPFFGLLDTAYRTGKTHVGVEVRGTLLKIDGSALDAYFDFVYHPERDVSGKVTGILAQAADVTERVLDRQVRETREQQLFDQWAELETI